MTVRVFRGISTVMFLRLCSRAPRTTSESLDIALERTQGGALGSILGVWNREQDGECDPVATPRGQPRQVVEFPRMKFESPMITPIQHGTCLIDHSDVRAHHVAHATA